jgi:hypothetical protein
MLLCCTKRVSLVPNNAVITFKYVMLVSSFGLLRKGRYINRCKNRNVLAERFRNSVN